MTIIRGLAVVAVLAGAAVGLAGPASAEPLSGDYTATVIDGGGGYREGKTATWTFAPCGPDCTQGGVGELHLQDGMWTGDQPGTSCNTAIDASSLVMTRTCGNARVVWQLVKNG